MCKIQLKLNSSLTQSLTVTQSKARILAQAKKFNCNFRNLIILCFLSRNNQICKSNSYTRETVELAKLPDNFIATDFHWYNSRTIGSQSAGGSGNNEALLISSNDGRFIILNKGIRMEKNISAHSMAIVSGRWSTDGAGLFTGDLIYLLIYS